MRSDLYLATTFTAVLLAACGEPVTRTSPLPVDMSAGTISAADLNELDFDGLARRLVNDLRGMTVEMGKVDDRDHLNSTLVRLEEVGTDYRTIALRFERAMDGGSEEAADALRASRPDLESVRDAMLSRRDALSGAYPDLETDIRETFDKFDFGFLDVN